MKKIIPERIAHTDIRTNSIYVYPSDFHNQKLEKLCPLKQSNSKIAFTL